MKRGPLAGRAGSVALHNLRRSGKPSNENQPSSESQVMAIALIRKGFHSGKHLTQSGPFLKLESDP